MTTACENYITIHADKNHRSGAGPWPSKTARVARLAPIGTADARHLASARWRWPLTGGIREKIRPANVPRPQDARRATTAGLSKTKFCMAYGTWARSARLDGHA